MAKTTSIDKSLFNGLKETLAQNPETPTQRVTAVGEKKKKVKVEEAPFTLWIPRELMRNIKLKALNTDSTIKEIILSAVKKSI